MYSSSSLLISLFSFGIIVASNGYIFDCLENCKCDTDDAVIHCHNDIQRTRLQLPDKRLRGFTVLGLTRNDIRVLPSQEFLLDKFPDLEAVDVELNPNFECSTLSQYDKITVMNSCDKDPAQIAALANTTTIVESIGNATEDCDTSCQTRRYYASLHEYLLKLWKMIKQKFGDLTNDSQFFKEVQDFFNEVGKRMTHFAKHVKEEIDGNKTAHPDNDSLAVTHRDDELERSTRETTVKLLPIED